MRVKDASFMRRKRKKEYSALNTNKNIQNMEFSLDALMPCCFAPKVGINMSTSNSSRIMVSSMAASSPLNSLNWCRLELVTVECGGVRPLRRPLAAR